MAKEEPTIFESVYPRYVLGLDVSTACIGVCVLKDNGDDKPDIMYLSHKTPKIPRKIKGIEALFLRKQIFEDEFVKEVSSAFPITDVVIEEPLISSNNANTVATLLRFNGMIAECVYRILGIVPSFISSYDARPSILIRVNCLYSGLCTVSVSDAMFIFFTIAIPLAVNLIFICNPPFLCDCYVPYSIDQACEQSIALQKIAERHLGVASHNRKCTIKCA